MAPLPFSSQMMQRLSTAARHLRTVDPERYVGSFINDSFQRPVQEMRSAHNISPRSGAPLEPLFSAEMPRSLSFSMEPLGPDASGSDKRSSTNREMRRLVDGNFGRGALHWFDEASEGFRGMSTAGSLNYGAFFGSSFDNNGLQSASVSYEGGTDQISQINPALARLIGASMAAMPGLRPIFTTLVAGRDYGSQWATFLITNGIRVSDLQTVMDELGLGQKLAQIMQIIGIALGGRFDLPPGSSLVAFGRGPNGVEMELQVMLDAISDLPPNFLQLLTMNLRERPRELTALQRFIDAFTPENDVWPGSFSVLGIRIAPQGPPKVSLFLRPVEFELPFADAAADNLVRAAA